VANVVMRERLAEAFSALSLLAAYRSYRRLWVLKLGAGTLVFAMRLAILVTIARGTGSVVSPAQFVLIEGVAAFCSAPLVGLIIDRTSPRQMLVFVGAVRAFALVIFAVFPSVELLLPLLIGLLSCCAVMEQAAGDACVLDTVPVRSVAGATALDQVAGSIAIIAGPILGATLAGGLELPALAAMWALVNVAFALLARGLPRPSRRASEQPGVAATFGLPRKSLSKTGARVFVAFFFGALAGNVWLALAPALIKGVFQSAASWIGVQMTLAGLGAIGGSLVAARIIERQGCRPILFWAGIAEAAGLAAYGLSGTLAAASIAIIWVGVAAGAFLSAFYTDLQRSAEPGERGQIFALVRQVDTAAVGFAGALALIGAEYGWRTLCAAVTIYAVSALSLRVRATTFLPTGSKP
jgi:predicted MFS family arabinose efflux permease